VSSIQATFAASRAKYSAAASGVRSKPLLEPTTWDGREHDPVPRPAGVLDHRPVLAHVALALERHRLGSQAGRLGEMQRTHPGQPLERVEPTGRFAAAVGPFVVARRVNQRMPEIVEVVAHLLQRLVGAGAGPALDVADVKREHRLHLVDRGDQTLEAGVVVGQLVRHVADGDERERLLRHGVAGECQSDAESDHHRGTRAHVIFLPTCRPQQPK
jgi:hypothetical protein